MMAGTCPTCGIRLVFPEASLPPDRIVSCPNKHGGCGHFWYDNRQHWFPQLLHVRKR